MPQLALVMAGAGLAGFYAGYRWFERELARQARRARTVRSHARPAAGPRDLGALEWDPAAGVYRPRVARATDV